jgi:hypothetical protein
MKSCGHFRYVRELILNNDEVGNGKRLIDLAMSQGGVAVLKTRLNDWNTGSISSIASAPTGTVAATSVVTAPSTAATELQAFNDEVKKMSDIATLHMPSSERLYPWVWNYRVRMGIV